MFSFRPQLGHSLRVSRSILSSNRLRSMNVRLVACIPRGLPHPRQRYLTRYPKATSSRLLGHDPASDSFSRGFLDSGRGLSGRSLLVLRGWRSGFWKERFSLSLECLLDSVDVVGRSRLLEDGRVPEKSMKPYYHLTYQLFSASRT